MPKARIPRVLAVAIVAIITFSMTAPASAHAVICKYNQFDIDSRDDNQLRILFGTSVCVFRRFSFRSDAESFARNNNMQPGRACSCR
jgi:hypothetical protein